MEWFDKNGRVIKAGDKLHNKHDKEPYYTVLGDDAGNLYLGDMDSPFGDEYCFGEFWEVVV